VFLSAGAFGAAFENELKLKSELHASKSVALNAAAAVGVAAGVGARTHTQGKATTTCSAIFAGVKGMAIAAPCSRLPHSPALTSETSNAEGLSGIYLSPAWALPYLPLFPPWKTLTYTVNTVRVRGQCVRVNYTEFHFAPSFSAFRFQISVCFATPMMLYVPMYMYIYVSM